MRNLIIPVAILLLSVIPNNNESTSEANASWEAYCVAYNVNPYAPTVEQEDYFLDCWRGSVEEENALGI